MKISMIVAFAEGRVIGTGDGIPWHLPRDSRHFREFTEGKAMLLGRRTFGEMDGWFTSQRPIVLTRDGDFSADGALGVVGSLEAAFKLARETGEAELVVSGGAEVYELAMQFADELVVTEVEGAFDGVAFFPEIDAAQWAEVSRERFEADGENSHAMSFVVYRRC